MDTLKTLSHSLQDYLETILILEKKNRVARVKDIADNLSVQMPSVTGALKSLKKKGLINYEKNSFISLTDDGMQIASRILERHKTINHFLEEILLVSKQTADGMACELEHSIDKDTARKLAKLSTYIETHVFSKLDKESWKKIIEE